MRRLISVILAVILAASLSVTAFYAVETDTAAVADDSATVTLKNIKGESVTQTYSVGETFTAYTYLNTSEIGAVSSVDAEQNYTSDVLEPVISYVKDAEDFDYGMIDGADMKKLFPVLSNVSSIANAGFPGTIYYNASTASLAGCKFNSDDSVLIAVTYKVKTAGEAEIVNTVTTLAQSDRSLTKIVQSGVIKNDNFTMPIALTEPSTATYTVSGKVSSFLSDTEAVTVELLSDNVVVNKISQPGLTDYSFAVKGVSGKCVLRVSKANHVTRTYDITVSGDVAQDAAIYPVGDPSGDGQITVRDIAMANSYIKGGKLDSYVFSCADTNQDNKITVRDLAAMNSHIKGKKLLWTV